MRFVNGRIARYWGDDVRLPKTLEKVVAYAFKDRSAAENGDCEGAASGFLVSAIAATGSFPFIVTNKHVVEDGVTTFRIGDAISTVIIEPRDEDWTLHPDPNSDVAVWRVRGLIEASPFLFPTTGFIMESDLGPLDMRLGDDVCMIGRHLNYDGRLTNMPDHEVWPSCPVSRRASSRRARQNAPGLSRPSAFAARILWLAHFPHSERDREERRARNRGTRSQPARRASAGHKLWPHTRLQPNLSRRQSDAESRIDS